ncbi:MAG: NAD(+)/NADH kinase [Thermoleophilia bacterium]|nr:NAD(+)/NADH kinase [Thermoleophilia bacterium]
MTAARAVRRAAVVTHGRPEALGDALAQVEALAAARAVELAGESDTDADVDLAIALGGDGTMLRALHRFLGTGVPVVGVNFGRIGFLTSVAAVDLERGLGRVLAGEYKVFELATLALTVAGRTHIAINDVVATSARPGRMIELGSAVGGESIGDQACDGMICCTPSGSTAYNLSSGGPVIMWGLDAMAITYVAPHSLHARPLVVPPGLGLAVSNVTADVPVTVVVDGRNVGELPPGGSFAVDVGSEKGLLALLPEVTFFTRLRDVFL